MALPCFKIYKFITSEKSEFTSQLKMINFSSSPVVLQITNLEDKQLTVLGHIEEFLESIGKKFFPYDVYIISTCHEYTGHLSVFSNINLVPKHFKRKNRPLNSKEANLMKKVNLKQINLKNLNEKDYTLVLKKYAQEQKELKYLSEQEHFLKILKNSLVNIAES
jgi:hypothetical protein